MIGNTCYLPGDEYRHLTRYYDTFFKKIYQARSQKELKPPLLIGVGLDEQIVDNVPVEDHDYVLDHIITPKLIV